jgi:riboflavin synthase
VLAVETDRRNSRLLVEKGSVCVDGISLTVASVRPGEFAVNIIPHTWENTNLKQRRTGEPVNIEYDLVVKAVQQGLETRR